MTMALLNSLLMNKWVPSSYYKTISLSVKDGKYNPAMKYLDYFYKGESDYPIVLSINGDKTMLKGDETLNAFADTMIHYNRKILTIIESNFFDEKLMKAIEGNSQNIFAGTPLESLGNAFNDLKDAKAGKAYAMMPYYIEIR